jgi:hypothetical protein
VYEEDLETFDLEQSELNNGIRTWESREKHGGWKMFSSLVAAQVHVFLRLQTSLLMESRTESSLLYPQVISKAA